MHYAALNHWNDQFPAEMGILTAGFVEILSSMLKVYMSSAGLNPEI
jgi:hypothetical protein